MFTTANIIAAVLGGILGTIANSIVVGNLFDIAIMPLILSFGREAVAILVALLLIPMFARLQGAVAWIAGIAVLTILPSVLAKTVFGLGAPWGTVLSVNLVYAVVAVAVYALARGKLAKALN